GDDRIRLTNYGEFLERYPPQWEVDIFENSSWSCAHGVERWRSNCGCNSGRAGWNQEWRRPLREGLDWLRDAVTPAYEALASRYLRDPWAARDASIRIILDRSPENIDRFLQEHARRELNEDERVTVLQLLELQRQTQLMYTSCGWFFDELSGLETVQILQYAGRAIQLGQELGIRSQESGVRGQGSGVRGQATTDGEQTKDGRSSDSCLLTPDSCLEEGFLERLKRARSNL